MCINSDGSSWFYAKGEEGGGGMTEKKQVVDFEMEYLDFDYNKRSTKMSIRKILSMNMKVEETTY